MRGAGPSIGSSALFTEGHAGELLLEPVLLLRITGGREAVRQSEEAFLLLLASFKACLDELDKNTVGARMARLSQRLDATGSTWGEAHALADGFLYGCHGSIIHQHAP